MLFGEFEEKQATLTCDVSGGTQVILEDVRGPHVTECTGEQRCYDQAPDGVACYECQNGDNSCKDGASGNKVAVKCIDGKRITSECAVGEICTAAGDCVACTGSQTRCNPNNNTEIQSCHTKDQNDQPTLPQYSWAHKNDCKQGACYLTSGGKKADCYDCVDNECEPTTGNTCNTEHKFVAQKCATGMKCLPGDYGLSFCTVAP
jgi:hypothetical protein